MATEQTLKVGDKVRYRHSEDAPVMTISHPNRVRRDLFVCKYWDHVSNAPKEVTVAPADLILVSETNL